MFVIVGSSAAAIGCIKGIRRADAATPITLVTQEPFYSYARPQLTAFLAGTLTQAELLAYCDTSFYAANGVTVRTNTQVTAIDTASSSLQLSEGEPIAYEKLMLATGSRPFVPQIRGIEAVQNRFAFYTLTDAMALSAAVTQESRVLVLGAGRSGLACVEGLSGRCAGITVVDFAPRPLRAVENEGEDTLPPHPDIPGVQFYLHAAVASFDGNVAKLQNGKKLPFDVLVTASGTRPETQLLAAAGGGVGMGILVDANGATTLPNIYAAGSCTQQNGLPIQAPVLPPWQAAMAQGEAAGFAMASTMQAAKPPLQARVQTLRANAMRRKGDATKEEK